MSERSANWLPRVNKLKFNKWCETTKVPMRIGTNPTNHPRQTKEWNTLCFGGPHQPENQLESSSKKWGWLFLFRGSFRSPVPTQFCDCMIPRAGTQLVMKFPLFSQLQLQTKKESPEKMHHHRDCILKMLTIPGYNNLRRQFPINLKPLKSSHPVVQTKIATLCLPCEFETFWGSENLLRTHLRIGKIPDPRLAPLISIWYPLWN